MGVNQINDHVKDHVWAVHYSIDSTTLLDYIWAVGYVQSKIINKII
jgi:hypothetical protein